MTATTLAGLQAKVAIFLGENALLYGPCYRALESLERLGVSLSEHVLSVIGSASA
ncbi:MAG TPA: hypothetical protein VK726_12800 [Acetobacteraceae bacterium]|nr:hypothetical protein [Acetobacteraceae bacterium]